MNNNVAQTKTAKAKHHKQHKSLDFKTTFKLFYRYIKYYKTAFWISVASALVATAFNLILIIGMGDLTNLLTMLIMKNNAAADTAPNLIPDITTQYFLVFSGLLIVGYFINAFTNWLMNTLIIKISQRIGYKLRMDLFNKVQMLSVHYFDTHESGDIMSVLTNDVYNLVLFISNNLGQILYGFTSMLGMLIIMFLISPYISLIVIGLILICFVAIGYLAKKSGPAFVQQQVNLGKMNGFIEEFISGQNIVNLYSQQHTTEAQFKEINDSLTRDGERSQSLSGLLIPWLNFLMNFIIAFEMAIAFTFLANKIDFGSVLTNISLVPGKMNNSVFAHTAILTSLMLATRNFIQPINQMIGMFAQLQQAVAGSRRTVELFKQTNEINENETVDIVGTLKGKVEIKNLNFSYVEGKPILKNINLSVEPGQTVAIVGPTGSGKTTIINLLTKFYDITDGDIFLDKYNIKEVKKESIRKQVSIVLQDTYLFNTSVKENIRYAKQDATDEEIISAAKTAGCHDFIMQLEHQYDTKLTENAQELSSGQKQLIAIARAMLSPSSILILDEATSNIDTRTEKVVQTAMLKLIKNKTAFVIAHRLSTIRNADKIVVLKDGSILEIGNHKELMAKKGFYYNLNMSKTDNLDIEKD